MSDHDKRLKEWYRKLAEEMIKGELVELMEKEGFPRKDSVPEITEVLPVCYWITESPGSHLDITYLAVATQGSMQSSMEAGRNLGNTHAALTIALHYHHSRSSNPYVSVSVSYKKQWDQNGIVGLELAQRAVQIVTDVIGFTPTESDIVDELYMWYIE